MNLFNQSLPLLWIEAVDLCSGETLWMPYELVHTRFALPRVMGAGCFYASSNGLASGNHRLEALTHAICEVIERDATTLWVQSSDECRDGTCVDLDTVDDGACRHVLELYKKAEVDVIVWETTSDANVASFFCRITDRSSVDPLHATLGLGCHTDRGIALLRALTEAAQGRATFISGSRDDLFRDEYRAALNPIALASQSGSVSTGSVLRSFQDVPTRTSETFNEDLDWLVQRLEGVGVERVLAVDLTLPEFDIPVVKVVIPGLESLVFDPNYSPGKRAKSRVHRQQ